jgi:aspartyl-tRNA synthetase
MRDSNGLIDATHLNNLTSYNLFEEANKNPNHFVSQAIRHLHSESKVGDVFFSKINIDALQQGIRYMIYMKTNDNYIIGNQSETEIQVIMRSIYLQYCKHLENDILCQVKDLNSKVLNYAVPKILAELNHHITFINDISYLPIPLDRGKHVSSSGTKILYMNEL